MPEFAPRANIKSVPLWLENGQCLSRDIGTSHPHQSRSARHFEQVSVGVTPRTASLPSIPAIKDEKRVPSSDLSRFGKGQEYALRMAVHEQDRLKCWRLAYREYLRLGYTGPEDLEYRYSLHDALPDTGTFLVEKRGQAVGTISAFPNSPLGLPADDIYRTEIDALRREGRYLVEVGRLTKDRKFNRTGDRSDHTGG